MWPGYEDRKDVVAKSLQAISTPIGVSASERSGRGGALIGLALAALATTVMAWLTWNHSGQALRKQMAKSELYHTAQHALSAARDKVDEAASSKQCVTLAATWIQDEGLRHEWTQLTWPPNCRPWNTNRPGPNASYSHNPPVHQGDSQRLRQPRKKRSPIRATISKTRRRATLPVVSIRRQWPPPPVPDSPRMSRTLADVRVQRAKVERCEFNQAVSPLRRNSHGRQSRYSRRQVA